MAQCSLRSLISYQDLLRYQTSHDWQNPGQGGGAIRFWTSPGQVSGRVGRRVPSGGLLARQPPATPPLLAHLYSSSFHLRFYDVLKPTLAVNCFGRAGRSDQERAANTKTTHVHLGSGAPMFLYPSSPPLHEHDAAPTQRVRLAAAWDDVCGEDRGKSQALCG